jgi:predicted  nucleic acid-binding Zn-ribbon protein
MPTTAENLRDLHALHQRAKSLRDRLASGPKTLTARQAFLAKKRADFEAARDALKKLRADIKNKEVSIQAQRERTDDLRAKLNTVKKQAEYDAIRNEIAHANQNVSKLEDDVLDLMQKVETQDAALKVAEGDVSRLAADVDAMAREIAECAAAGEGQLAEIDSAIVQAEEIIPVDQREQYRRNVKGRADDAMAPVEDGACHGCYVAVTHQMMNELINGQQLVFCNTCGRILYLAEQPERNLRRVANKV